MISNPNTEQYSSKEAEFQRGWTRGSVPTRTLAPKTGGLRGPTSIGEENECQHDTESRRGWIVRSHIDWGGERNTLYKGVETCPGWGGERNTLYKGVETSP